MGDPNDPVIQGTALNFSKFTTWGAGIGTLGAAAAALIQTFQGANPAVIVGALGVVAVGLLAVALVTAVDVYSRAYVTAANSKASPPNQVDTPASQANGTNTLTSIEVPFCVKLVAKGPESFRVLAIGWNANTMATTYLVVRQAERPMWVKEDDIEQTDTLPQQVPNNGVGDHTTVTSKSTFRSLLSLLL